MIRIIDAIQEHKKIKLIKKIHKVFSKEQQYEKCCSLPDEVYGDARRLKEQSFHESREKYKLLSNPENSKIIKQDKEILSLYDWEIAYWLAFYSYRNEWKTNDKEILSLFDFEISYWLARRSNRNKWKTDDKEILLKPLVATFLARYSAENGWITHDVEILNELYVANYLSQLTEYNGWITHDKEVLKMSGGKVAWNLALKCGKNGWDTDDEEILNLCKGDVREILNLMKIIYTHYIGSKYKWDMTNVKSNCFSKAFSESQQSLRSQGY